MRKFGTKIGKNPFLQAFFRFYQASEIDLTSIAVAYYLLISIFPLLLIVVNILPYFRIPIAEFLEAIEGVLQCINTTFFWLVEFFHSLSLMGFFTINVFFTKSF